MRESSRKKAKEKVKIFELRACKQRGKRKIFEKHTYQSTEGTMSYSFSSVFISQTDEKNLPYAR